MKNLLSKIKQPKIILYLIGFLFVSFFYGKIILQPNNYMFSTSGDGIKNYYTYSYQITHGNSLTNFEGMNYPYGESILYTDCHPILTLIFQPLSKVIPVLKTHNIGILNLLLILGIFLTFVVIYHLLLRLHFNPWLSILFAFGITILAPQIFRLGGHFALSYSLAIPLSWFLFLKSEKGNWKWISLLFINNLFWLLIHAYLGIICLSFLLILVILPRIFKKFRKDNLTTFFKQLTCIILPILLFFVLTKTIDSHTDRTTNPSGFLLYNAELDDVFVPHKAPLRPLLDRISNGVIKLQWEAWSYVGIINSLLVLALLVLLILSFKSSKVKMVLKEFVSNRSIVQGLLAAFVVLIFALGIPFRQFPVLLDYFPVVKQFRATGRFTWPFYFAYTIFGAYIIQYLYYYFISKNKKRLAILIIVMLVGINLVEGLPYHQSTSKAIKENSNLFNKSQLSTSVLNAIEKIDPKDYQAILSLPFFYHGSEAFSRPRDDQSVTNSMVISYHTGLPMVNANLTRISVTESKKSVQLISPNYYNKPIEKDFTDARDFIIVHSKKDLTPYEKTKLSKGDLIYDSKEFALIKITKQALFDDEAKAVFNELKDEAFSDIKYDNFLISDTSSFFYYQDYEKYTSDTTFRGTGSFHGIKKGKNTLVEFPSNTFNKDCEYNLKVWMYNDEKDALNLWFRLMIEEYDPEKNEWLTTTFSPEHTEVINEDWSLVEGTFTIKNPSSQIAIITKGKSNSKANFHADDLLITENGVDVYKFEDEYTGNLFYNNHSLKNK